MKNYLKDDKLEVDNKARVDYKFKFDDEWNHSKRK